MVIGSYQFYKSLKYFAKKKRQKIEKIEKVKSKTDRYACPFYLLLIQIDKAVEAHVLVVNPHAGDFKWRAVIQKEDPVHHANRLSGLELQRFLVFCA